MKTIGILYPGEMGFAVGRLLLDAGYSVITSLHGRSDETVSRANDLGISNRESLRELATDADIVLSLVPPDEAVEAATRFADAARKESTIFVDANSISPGTAKVIQAMFKKTSVEFVDAAFHGTAQFFAKMGVLYISGNKTTDVQRIFEGSVRVRNLGQTIGHASALKMLMGGLSKGLAALLIELTAAAENGGMLPEYLDECRSFYPGIFEVGERVLPTYRLHARRRVAELGEVEQTISGWGSSTNVICGARSTLRAISEVDIVTEDLEHLLIAWSKLLCTSSILQEE